MIVLVALLLPVLLGGLGLVIDHGLAYSIRCSSQKAADAAALGAAHQLREGDITGFRAAARRDAMLNGAAVPDSKINIDRPPRSGDHAGDTNFVEVTIRREAPMYFMRSLHARKVTVEARATAGLLPKRTCVFALDDKVSPGLRVTGGARVEIEGCGAHVNSNAPTAAYAMAGSQFSADTIDVVGSYAGTGFSPTPLTGTAAGEDPLIQLPLPPVPLCTRFPRLEINDTRTLLPGVYCGGIELGPSAKVKLLPGVYILNGGGLEVHAGAHIEGDLVMFYNTSGFAGYQPISISPEATVELRAPTVLPYTGILFLHDRTIRDDRPNQIAGDRNSKLEGALYFPTAPLVVTGDSGTKLHKLLIVGKTVEFRGDIRFDAVDTSFGLSPFTLRTALVR